MTVCRMVHFEGEVGIFEFVDLDFYDLDSLHPMIALTLDN